MRHIPLSYIFYGPHIPAELRPGMMVEFKEHGASHLSLNGTLIREILANPKAAATLKEELAASEMQIATAHAPFGTLEDLNVPAPPWRGMMLDRLRLALRIAADFNAATIVIHTGNMPELFKEYTVDEMHRALLDSLRELVPLAEELGIIIAIENIWTPNNTPERLIDACETINSPNLGVCYDSGHANLMHSQRHYEETTATNYWREHGPVPWDSEILEKLLPYVVTCHLQDNHGDGDYHLVPGAGNIDWPHIAALLRQAPRLCNLECEVSSFKKGVTIGALCRGMAAIFGHPAYAEVEV